MCGISGAINFKGLDTVKMETVKAMNACLRHRGPDSDGLFADEFVAMGHRRLAILDLSPLGNQPMSDSSGNIIVVFNGEIYNFAELKSQLESEFRFRSHSDTEVIIYAYKKWGIDAIKKFTGMFALALYDKARRRVFLVRDRLGKKPLYYTTVGSTIYYASEMSAFFSANLLRKEANHQAVYNYLTFLSTDAPQTFFKGIFKVEAGSYAEISEERLNLVRYWNISDSLNSPVDKTYAEALTETTDLLERSMTYRNISDVPVAVALSGGIDSSLNLHYSKIENPDIKALNISYFQSSEFDESAIAERYSKDLKVEFIRITINDDQFAALISEYTSMSADVPSGDLNTSLLYLIAKTARKHNTKVLLVGEGGDELGGYPIYLTLDREHERFKHLAGISPLLRFLRPFREKAEMFYDGKIISKRHIHAFTEGEKKKFWTGPVCDSSYAVFAKYMDEISDDYSDSFLRKILNLEYKLRLPEMILPRIDYPSMAASVEARSPYMDHSLIEYSARLPFSVKMMNGPKSIIRDIAKTKLPQYILTQPKVGFGMMLTPFLKTTLPLWVKSLLQESDSPLYAYVSKKYLLQLVENANASQNSYRLWSVFALSTWLKKLEQN
jgi:asparagine synthase (glutamine-hydrolysing)